MNRERGKWAEKALRAFARQTCQSVKCDGWPEIGGDLICDLAHFCDRHDLELLNLVVAASRHYEAESTPDAGSKKVRGTQFDGLA
jgi:hypothetical protein